MAIPAEETRRVQVVEHPNLQNFLDEFGSHHDTSRYENIRSPQRNTSPSIAYLNELQMDGYLSAHTVLLLKNNLHDETFITTTTRSVLYRLKQSGRISDGCFNFLHKKLTEGDFLTVFRYLYILDLYSKVAESHDRTAAEPGFQFESPANYSEKLVKSPAHTVASEEKMLQDKSRAEFMKKWLSDRNSAIDPLDTANFREKFLDLISKLQKTSELEKFCFEELLSGLSPYSGSSFYEQAYLRLKTENYYRNCLARVTTLRESLERTNGPDLLAQAEKCKKAYNGSIYLLGDNKNMAPCCPMRFAALTGNMRAQWQKINQAFARASQDYSHRLCACQAQMPASQNELADWPFNSYPLITINPVQAVTPQQLQQRGIDQQTYQDHGKRTIAVLGCKWGGGHMEIARGISNNLTSLGYHAVTVDLPEVLISEDPVRSFFLTRWLGKKWCYESLYVGLIQEKAYAMINFVRWIAGKLFPSGGYSEMQLKLIMEHLLKINPDAVAVDYTMHNEALIKACENLGIPIMHVGADINNVVETRDKPPAYPHFKMALPFDVPEVVNSVVGTTTAEQRVITGPPVKHEFTLPRTQADIQQLKQKWGIDVNKKVVIVANGLAGGFSPYPEILAKKYANTPAEQIPVHVVVLCGKTNDKFKRHLEQSVMPKTNMPMTVELFTPKMEELLAMASYGGVLIGKAGTTTVFESIVRGTRLLIDNVPPHFMFQGVKHFFVSIVEMILRKFGFEGQIFWEKDNADFSKKIGLADNFEEEKDFLPKLEQMLANDNLPVRHNIEIKNVETEIPKHLSLMLGKAELDPIARRAREVRKNL